MSLSYNSDKEFTTLMFPDEQECCNVKDVIDLLREDLESNPDDKNIRFQLAAAEVSHESWMLITEGVKILENLTAEELTRKISGWKARNAEIENHENKYSNVNTDVINNDINKGKNTDDCNIENKNEENIDINVVGKAENAPSEQEYQAGNNSQETHSSILSVSTEEVTPLLVQGVCVSCASAPPPEELDEQESNIKNARKDDECSLPPPPQQKEQEEESNCQVYYQSEPEELQQHLQNVHENYESKESSNDQSSVNTGLSDWNIYSQLCAREGDREHDVRKNSNDKCDSEEGKNYNNNNSNDDDDNGDNVKTSDNELNKKRNDCESTTTNDDEYCDNSLCNSYSSEWIELISTRDKISIEPTPTRSVCSFNNDNANSKSIEPQLESQINKQKISQQISEMERCLSSKDDDIDAIAPREMSDLAFYYYYLTVGYSKLNEREKARVYLEEALKLAPLNKKVITLKEYICGKDKPVLEKQPETTEKKELTQTKSEPIEKHDIKEQEQCESKMAQAKNFTSNDKFLIAGTVIGGIGIGALLYYFFRRKKRVSPESAAKLSKVVKTLAKT